MSLVWLNSKAMFELEGNVSQRQNKRASLLVSTVEKNAKAYDFRDYYRQTLLRF